MKSRIIHGIDISILVHLPSSTIATSCTSIIWAFGCSITSSISVDSVNKLWMLVESTVINVCIFPSSTTIKSDHKKSNQCIAIKRPLCYFGLLNSRYTVLVVWVLADRWQFILRVSTKFKNSGNQQFGDHEFLVFNTWNVAFLTIVCFYSQLMKVYNSIL